MHISFPYAKLLKGAAECSERWCWQVILEESTKVSSHQVSETRSVRIAPYDYPSLDTCRSVVRHERMMFRISGKHPPKLTDLEAMREQSKPRLYRGFNTQRRSKHQQEKDGDTSQ